MPGKTTRLLLSPATALLNRMTFYGKFAVLALIALLAVGITIFSLYASLNQVISYGVRFSGATSDITERRTIEQQVRLRSTVVEQNPASSVEFIGVSICT